MKKQDFVTTAVQCGIIGSISIGISMSHIQPSWPFAVIGLIGIASGAYWWRKALDV